MGRSRNFDLDEALDRATREFWDRGYAGTTIDDLAVSLGVAKPSLYRAFGNKQALFARVVEHFEAVYLSFVDEALADRPVRHVVERLLDGTVRACTGAATPPGSLLTHAAPANSPEDRAIRQLLSDRIEAYETKLVTRLTQAKDECDLPDACDPVALSSFITTHCCGIALRAKAGVAAEQLAAESAFVMAAVPASRCIEGSDQVGAARS